ncbi:MULTISPECIES: hypothetical protein [Pectobacterium]|uniref:hypothetical protein n=1 Tax=Pectobacterium TaxID=122277 RepID=UPI0004E7B054|nr:hypothetical protein [Pectobacterium brasiliense]KFF61785.1 hypothetical protein IV99_21210 [Pectobacterium brasiliense]
MSTKKPGFSTLFYLMAGCFLALSCTVALVYFGVWLYYQFILQMPSGMYWQPLLIKALRIGIASGPVIGMGVWIHMRMEYSKGDKR